MLTLRSLLAGVLLATLAGCSSEYWKSPSVLTTAPPDPPAARPGAHESKGGFSVLVDAPGQPTAARAAADIGAYARKQGYTQVSTGAGGTRYVSGKVALDVFFREEDLHVVARLHCVGLSRRLAEDFYRGFNREYAPQYGEENPIIANDFEPYVRTPI